MNDTATPVTCQPRERGAALIVGLVIMTVLTILAISTMRTSTLELAMAGNAQYREQAVQLAEIGLQDAVSRIDNGILPLNATDSWFVNFSEIVPAASDGDLGRYDVTIRFTETGAPPGGQSKTKIIAHYFEIESTGMSAGRNARSTLRQGFWIPAAT